MQNMLYNIFVSVCIGKGWYFKNMYTYIHFNQQIRSGIRKFQDLMNGPHNRS